jgi:hypothetical protein
MNILDIRQNGQQRLENLELDVHPLARHRVQRLVHFWQCALLESVLSSDKGYISISRLRLTVGTPPRATRRCRAAMLIPTTLATLVLHPSVIGARSSSDLATYY